MRANPDREDRHQAAIIQWSNLMQRRWAELRWLVHTPNGGNRNRGEAARLIGQGVRAGWPDLILPVRRGAYVGLAIELKRLDGGAGMTADQYDALDFLQRNGWLVAECWGSDVSIERINSYMANSITPLPGVKPDDIPIIKPDGSVVAAKRKAPRKPSPSRRAR